MKRRTVMLVLSLVGCNYVPSPETAFRARTVPSDVEVSGDLAPGVRVRFADVQIEVLDVEARKSDELVSPSVRDALDDAAVAATAVATVARATDDREVETRTAQAAKRASQVAALVSVLGAFAASRNEDSEIRLRARVGDRGYRATCASTNPRAVFDPYARPSLSCAIVPTVANPTRRWALAVRTTKAGFQVPRHEGYVEARTAKGRDDTVPILRIYTSDEHSLVPGPNGKEQFVTHFNARFELATPAGNVGSVLTRSYAAKPRVWLDASSLADVEARDIAGVAAAILQLHRWPEPK